MNCRDSRFFVPTYTFDDNGNLIIQISNCMRPIKTSTKNKD